MNKNPGNSEPASAAVPTAWGPEAQDLVPDEVTQTKRGVRIAGVIGLLFLILSLLLDLQTGHLSSALLAYHLTGIAALGAYVALTWDPHFPQRWKLETLLVATAVLWFLIVTSFGRHDAESPFIAAMLIPFAAAAFLSWDLRWQTALNAACLVSFACAQFFFPVPDGYGTYRWLGFIAALLYSHFIAAHLQSNRRQMGEQLAALRQAAQFRERQASTLAHDIRNPLAVITGMMRVIEEGGLDEQARGDVLVRIGSAARKVDALVSNVLALYQIEGHRLKPYHHPGDPNEIVAEVARDHRGEAARKRIGLTTSLDELPQVSIDPLHFERIVANLIANALALTSAGEVAVASSWSQGILKVTVTSRGGGVSPEAVEHLFDPPDGGDATGPLQLDLYVARALAMANGGFVSLSLRPGQGWVVTLEIPAERETT